MKHDTNAKHIGALIRDMRKSAGMSQAKLGEKLGVSYQQVQKYEKGESQLNVRRLLQFTDVFGVPVGTFFKNGRDGVAQASPNYSALSDEEARLVMLFRRLRTKKLRIGFTDMLRDILKLSEVGGK
jgi:transcriptional regulator with XRE-family HTH domain